MCRFAVFCCLLALTGPLLGQDKELEQPLAMQKAMQQAIARAEPAIACILVSRSEAYRRLPGLPPEASGKLGDVNQAMVAVLAHSGDLVKARSKFDLGDPDYVPEAFGSGVVIDPQGLVLTNYHVIRDATKVFMRLPGDKSSYCDIHAADPRSDLAVLRVLNRHVLPLKTIPLGDGAAVQRGQFVLTLANPFAAGMRDGQPSASWGVISNLRRPGPGPENELERVKPLHYYGTLLQTDARIHLGCSGGALLDLSGKLIGITTSLAAIHGTDIPGGFALPLDGGMRRIVEVLKRGEEVEYGFLGVTTSKERPELGKGVIVNSVIPGSPASQEARLKVGNVILAINDATIENVDDLFLQLATQLAGTKVKLMVRHARSAPVRIAEVTLGKYHVPGKRIVSSLGNRPFFRGLRVDYTTLLAQPSPSSRVPSGVLVSEVQPSSAAAQAQLKPGEVITHVNNRPVASPAAFYQAVAGLQGPVEFLIHNRGAQEPPSKVVLK